MLDSWIPFPPRRVLVASDLGNGGDEAIRQAGDWARASAADVLACHVVPGHLQSDPLFPRAAASPALDVAAVTRTATRELERRVASLLGTGLQRVDVRVEQDDPRASIVEIAEEWGADLVVVGDSGGNGAERPRLGSVAEGVVRYAHCPALIARPRSRSGRLMVATDLSRPSLQAVRAAADLGRRTGARLTVAHAIEPGVHLAAFAAPSVEGIVSPAWSVASEEARTLAAKAISELIRRLELDADSKVLEGTAAMAILSAVEEMRPELLVIAARGRTGLARAALGSVAEGVARRAPSPVLIVRPVRGVAP